MTVFGELTINWSKQMLTPKNETWFIEQLKRTVTVIEKETRLKVKKPALEVTFLQSYAHNTIIKFDWEYSEWIDKKNMRLRLKYDKPEIVSMEIPTD